MGTCPSHFASIADKKTRCCRHYWASVAEAFLQRNAARSDRRIGTELT
jgi:hypothetical protein